MTVTDGDRYAIAMAKLSQARSAVYEATRIIEHLFESDGPAEERQVLSCSIPVDSTDHDCDPITGLYPGQQADPDTLLKQEDDEGAECLD